MKTPQKREIEAGKIPVRIYDYPTTWEISATIIITAFAIFGIGKILGWF